MHEEWVYNEADLKGAEVVWARSMVEAQDRALTERFSGSRVWWLDFGAEGARPTPASP